MKSERRHELEQNRLAQWVAGVVQRVRPHVNKILLGVAVLLAAIVIVSVWRAAAAGSDSAAWETFYAALGEPGTDHLETLAEKAPNARAGRWATVVAGDIHLAQGCRLLFENKANATQELRKAVVAYNSAIESSGTVELELLQRAYFGRAKAHESLAGADLSNREELDKAVADYQELITRWPDGPYTAVVKRQLDILGSTQGKRFYEKLATYTPKPPGVRPSLDELLRQTMPEGGTTPTQPLLEGILKGLDVTAPRPEVVVPPAKPSAEPSPAAKSQPPVLEPPKTGPAKTEPGKTESPTTEAPKAEPARPEPAKTSPAPEPAKAAPSTPEVPKAEPAKPEAAKAEPEKK